MAKKYGLITVAAYARTRDGGLADADTLDERRKRKLATELSCRLLNEAYAGQGVQFFPASGKTSEQSGGVPDRARRREEPEGNARKT